MSVTVGMHDTRAQQDILGRAGKRLWHSQAGYTSCILLSDLLAVPTSVSTMSSDREGYRLLKSLSRSSPLAAGYASLSYTADLDVIVPPVFKDMGFGGALGLAVERPALDSLEMISGGLVEGLIAAGFALSTATDPRPTRDGLLSCDD